MTVLVRFAQHGAIGTDEGHADLRVRGEAMGERIERVGVARAERIAAEIAGDRRVAREPSTEDLSVS